MKKENNIIFQNICTMRKDILDDNSRYILEKHSKFLETEFYFLIELLRASKLIKVKNYSGQKYIKLFDYLNALSIQTKITLELASSKSIDEIIKNFNPPLIHIFTALDAYLLDEFPNDNKKILDIKKYALDTYIMEKDFKDNMKMLREYRVSLFGEMSF